MYVPPPFITTVRPWFATIGYNGEIREKGTLKKICLPPSWRLLMGQIIQCLEPPFTDHMEAICNLDVHVDSKAPKYSSLTEEETTSNSAIDISPSHPLPPTSVVGEMHKEAQQAVGGPTSLGDTSEDRSHPQFSSGSNLSVLVDKTKSAGDGLKTAHTTSSANKESGANDILQNVKLEDLAYILKDTRPSFFTPDSPTDEPIIVSYMSEKEENAENDKDTEDTLVPPPSPKSAQLQELMAQVHLLQSQKKELEQAKATAQAEVASLKAKPSYPDINQLTNLLVTSLKPELSKLLASHDFTCCLPIEPKELPSKIIRLSGEIKELKQHIKDIELELPRDL
nr:hypothetical protein [Tanacetum cinerariifolium]